MNAPAEAAEFLLIDISNSFTKLALSSRSELLGEVARIRTAELTAGAIRSALAPDASFRCAALSSVAPSADAAVEQFMAEAGASSGGAAPRLLRVSCNVELGVGIDYPDPASIGADRLANAAGAAAFYGAPAVVVDFGTAVTFDVLAELPAGPAYVGGVIAPGLEAMTDYLYQRTALLPRIELSEPVAAIGKSTRDAMLAGAVFGYRGLVRQILEELRRELKTPRKLHIVATGGYAELIAAQLPEIQIVHPNLTLEGLRMICLLNAQTPA